MDSLLSPDEQIYALVIAAELSLLLLGIVLGRIIEIRIQRKKERTPEAWTVIRKLP